MKVSQRSAPRQADQAVPGCNLSQPTDAHHRTQPGVVARLYGLHLPGRACGDMTKDVGDVERPHTVERQVGALRFTEEPTVDPQATLGAEVVKGGNRMATPRRVPVGPRHICPTSVAKNALDLVEGVQRCGRVLEHVGAQDGVETAVGERQRPSVADDAPIRRIVQAMQGLGGNLESGRGGAGVLHRVRVQARTTADIEYAAIGEQRKRGHRAADKFSFEHRIATIAQETTQQFTGTDWRYVAHG